jgi:hypothetical protein
MAKAIKSRAHRAWQVLASAWEIFSLLVFQFKMKLAKVPRLDSYKVISLGLGQQSTTLYLMSSTGAIERADVAIFSDPGSEGTKTYKHLRWLKQWAKENNGIPIICTGKKSLYRDIISGLGRYGRRFASIPAFTRDWKGKIGMLKRQCTQEYKTNEVNKTIRKLYGLRGHKRTPSTEIWLAITQEEMERMRFPSHNWMSFVYPFLNVVSTKFSFERIQYTGIMRRADCLKWLTENNFPIPPKSACTFCPFQGDQRWLELKKEDPKEWERVVKLDELIRNSTKKGVHQPIYLHRSCKPLSEAELHENQLDLFISECSGGCGI